MTRSRDDSGISQDGGDSANESDHVDDVYATIHIIARRAKKGIVASEALRQ